MASASHTEIFNCTNEEFFKLISDYEKYPEFLVDVKACKVIKSEGHKKWVQYKVSVIKSFEYVLLTTESAPNKISWEFASGEVFKTSTGSWVLTEEPGGKTKAQYSVEATFSMFVPGPIAKTLLAVNLPAMMAAYHKRIQLIYGK